MCCYPFGSRSRRKIAFTCSLKLASMCVPTLTSISPRFQSLRRHKKQYFCLCLRFSWVVAPFIVDDRRCFRYNFYFAIARSKFLCGTQHQIGRSSFKPWSKYRLSKRRPKKIEIQNPTERTENLKKR